MSHHPYWAYGPDASGSPGDPEEYAKAIDEGRRMAALELAVKSFQGDLGAVGRDILNRANTFEGYLKGEDA